MATHTESALSKFSRAGATILLSIVSFLLCGCDNFDCSPHLEETRFTSNDERVAQRWIAICGAPGATVTDIITITSDTISSPSAEAFAFNEEPNRNAAGSSVSISWIDVTHLKIQVDEIGDIRSSPRHMDGIDIAYALGPQIDPQALKDQIYQKSEDRHQLERLKSSESWHMVESLYDADSFVIERNRKFLKWIDDYVQFNRK